jgi:hypothetical protein
MTVSFKALLTPLVHNNVYGSTVDVTQDLDITEYINRGGTGRISQKLDADDFDIGLFKYGKVTLQAINSDGKFNSEHDARSLFPYKRDLAKLQLIYVDNNDTEYTVFRGLLNDEGTTATEGIIGTELGEDIKLTFVAQESVFRKVQVTGGLVSDGQSFSNAIKKIIDRPEITSVMGYDSNNISVDYDGTVDNAEAFNQKNTREVLNSLLLASNSVMYVDSSNDMVVSPRTERTMTPHEFYGGGDLLGRENIIKVEKFNSGYQRMFNSVTINDDSTSIHQNNITRFGLKDKAITLDFITTEATELAIAATIVDEFSFPQEEITITVSIDDAKTVKILDKTRLNYPYKLRPADDKGLPVAGQIKANDGRVFPHLYGNMVIDRSVIWKVIEINHNLSVLQTSLKLRRIGNEIADSVSP